MPKHRINTIAVHAGERPERPDYTPVTMPVYNSVGYLYDDMADLDLVFAGSKDGYVYSRFGNPTNRALERALAQLEGGADAIVFSSGMAALHATLLACGAAPGARILAAPDLYGATYNMLARFFDGLGVATTFLNLTDLGRVELELEKSRPVALILEVMSNPLLKLADVTTLAQMAHRHGTSVIVDSTFTTPYLVKPLELGADYVVQSTTKYLSGHGDALGGAVIANAKRVAELRVLSKHLGSVLGPNEAYLTLRGLKTFPLRMAQHCANALQVARWLERSPAVAGVIYPGLPSHPQRDLARQLFGERRFGGMIAFEIRDGDQDRVFRFFEALELILPATTLGDVYSLVLYPAHSSHRTMTPSERQTAGIGPGLVRLSVGIEAAEDIIEDLSQALSKVE